ncbi:MAG TPA: FliH/SctL family protein [Burkholderiaceae bacterium]|nr:FliH/SctL family protein [Burkholderiaceae bacterium]
MGASDKVFSRLIPKEQVGEAASWEFESLGGQATPARGTEKLLLERERRAFEKGRAQGRVEGHASAQRDLQQQNRQLERVLAELRGRFAELESSGADQVLDLALEVARQVLRHELSVQREALLPVMREAVAAVIDHHAHPRVFLNPQDHAVLAASLDADGLFKGCRFIGDPSITPGGCRVETPHNEIDARLETRWQRVLDALGIERA